MVECFLSVNQNDSVIVSPVTPSNVTYHHPGGPHDKPARPSIHCCCAAPALLKWGVLVIPVNKHAGYQSQSENKEANQLEKDYRESCFHF